MVAVINHLIQHRLKEWKPLITAGFEHPREGKNYFLY